MVRGITFDKQLLKSEDFAHQVNYFYQGNMGVTRGCGISTDVNGDLVVGDGYFAIYGRLIRNVGDTVINVPTTSVTLYSILVFEIDLSKDNTIDSFNQGSFKILSSSSAYPVLTKNNLDNGGSIYQMEFCRFTNTVSGISNLSDTRTILSLVMYATKTYTDSELIKKANASHSHDFDDISGILPIAKGGTGANTSSGTLTNLGITASAAELNHIKGVSSNIQDQINTKASKSNVITATLTAVGWGGTSAPYSQTLSVNGVTSNNNVIFDFGMGITSAQIDAGLDAKIKATSQGTNTVLIKAFGDKPSIDIPVQFVILG